MTNEKQRHPGIEIVIAEAGGVSRLASFLGITSSAVSQWREIPLRHIAMLEERYQIPRHELRPNVYPPGYKPPRRR